MTNERISFTPPRVVAPSILASDYGKFGEEAADVERAGGDWLHLDVMDGHFVENISFGPGVVKALRPHTELFFDVHLMITNPQRYWQDFVKAGANGITVHVEADHDIRETLQLLRKAGMKAGLALNPATPFEKVAPFLTEIDLLLVMTVVPGFGGQSFMRETIPKIQEGVSERERLGLGYHIEVDGGIDAETAVEATGAGANVLVAGTTIFKAPDRAAAIQSLRDA